MIKPSITVRFPTNLFGLSGSTLYKLSMHGKKDRQDDL